MTNAAAPFPRLALVVPAAVPLLLILAAGATDFFGNTNVHGDMIPVILFLLAVFLVAGFFELKVLPRALKRLRLDPAERTPANIACTGLAAAFFLAWLILLTVVLYSVLL